MVDGLVVPQPGHLPADSDSKDADPSISKIGLDFHLLANNTVNVLTSVYFFTVLAVDPTAKSSTRPNVH